jgi:hypothetical protein
MQFTDHGDWVLYRPRSGPSDIAFCKRVQDDQDWYKFQKELKDPDTVKITLRKSGDVWIVMSTQTDASMLFPADCKLIEIEGVKDHEKLRSQVFDLESKKFSQRKVEASSDPIKDLSATVKKLVERIEQLEKK